MRSKKYGVWIAAICSLFTAISVFAQTTISENSEYQARIDEAMQLSSTEPETARKLAQDLFDAFEDAGDSRGQAEMLRIMAVTYAPSEDWESARKYFEKALTYLDEFEHTDLYARNLQSIGATYINTSSYGKAYEYNARALALSQKHNYKVGIARSDYYLGVILNDVYDNEAAIKHLTAALASEDLPDQTRTATNRALGTAYTYNGEPEKALAFFERALALDPGQSPWRKAIIHSSHAKALADLKRYDEAEAHANKALELAEKHDYPEYICQARLYLGQVALGRDLANEAIELLDYDNCSYEAPDEKFQNERDVAVLPLMIEAQLKAGQAEQAQETLTRVLIAQEKRFRALKASSLGVAEARLRIADREGQIAFLEQQDEINKLQLTQQRMVTLFAVIAAAIALLVFFIAYRNYRSQKSANNVLRDRDVKVTRRALDAEKSLEYKTLLIHETNHRVKNNLQTIISLLNTQRRHLGPATTSQASAMLNDISGRVGTMAIVQQSLNDLDEVGNLRSKPFIPELISRLVMSSAMEVDVSIDIDDIYLTADIAAPLALIINELVSNSSKHAFKTTNSGALHIALNTVSPGNYRLSCQDTGPGLPEDFDLESLDSFGLSIVQLLAEQINGALSFERCDPGVKWIVAFKLKDRLEDGQQAVSR